MAPTSKEDQRLARLRAFDTVIESARAAVGALALLVQGREARADGDDAPLEMSFAGPDNSAPSLPAALWVALRRGDVDTALGVLARASETQFVVGEREEMGSGYRLETVEEKLPVPDVVLLQVRLAGMLAIPADVVAVLASWGPDDPRTHAEVEALLDSRFGVPTRPDPQAPTVPETLSMSVAELADVLQLAPEQAKVLATLARRTQLAVTSSEDYSPDASHPSGGPIDEPAGPNAST